MIYYTLRAKTADSLKDEILDCKFDTYEEAYDAMCLFYMSEKNKNILPHKFWKIWRTSEYNGNSMTQLA